MRELLVANALADIQLLHAVPLRDGKRLVGVPEAEQYGDMCRMQRGHSHLQRRGILELRRH